MAFYTIGRRVAAQGCRTADTHVDFAAARSTLDQERVSAGAPIDIPNPENQMSTDEKPKGPASYFPSIEKNYGQPIEHWLIIARGLHGMSHMETVNRLKAEHGLGHGHANAIVAFVLAEANKDGSRPSPAA